MLLAKLVGPLQRQLCGLLRKMASIPFRLHLRREGQPPLSQLPGKLVGLTAEVGGFARPNHALTGMVTGSARQGARVRHPKTAGRRLLSFSPGRRWPERPDEGHSKPRQQFKNHISFSPWQRFFGVGSFDITGNGSRF